MKSIQVILYAAISIAMLCCSGGLQTSSKLTDNATLENYKTYAWVVPPDPDGKSRDDDKIFAPLIQQQADAALQKKGLKLDTLKPDVVFLFDAHVEDRVKYSKAPVSRYSYYFGGPGYYAGYAPPLAGGEILPEEYAQGMLAFEMSDASSKKVIWRGWAEKPLTGKSDVEADIKRAVRDIFSRLPIKQKK